MLCMLQKPSSSQLQFAKSLSLAVTKIARYEISKNLEANALNIAHPSEHLPNAFLSHVPKSYKSLVYQNPKNKI
jgi:hypothetical protein